MFHSLLCFPDYERKIPQECKERRERQMCIPVLGAVSQNWVSRSCPPGALKQHRSSTTVVLWQLNSGFKQVFGPVGKPVGVLVGAEVDVVREVLEEVVEIDVVKVEEVTAGRQLHALFTRLITLPVQAVTANDGIALVAVTDAVVNVPQNDWAASRRLVARRARRQLSALQLAATAIAGRSSGRRREDSRDIFTEVIKGWLFNLVKAFTKWAWRRFVHVLDLNLTREAMQSRKNGANQPSITMDMMYTWAVQLVGDQKLQEQ
jgi:hypothetical protein